MNRLPGVGAGAVIEVGTGICTGATGAVITVIELT